MAATRSKSKRASRSEAARLGTYRRSAYNRSCDGKAEFPRAPVERAPLPVPLLPAGPSLSRLSESRIAAMPELRAFLFPRIRLLPWRHDHHVHSYDFHRGSRVCRLFGASRGTALARKLHVCVLGRIGYCSRYRADASRVQLMAVARFLDRSVEAGRAEITRQRFTRSLALRAPQQ